MGGLIVLSLLACAALYWLGSRAVARNPFRARNLFWLALAAGLLCCVFQIYEFWHLGFDPQLGGGYPSVFVGLKLVLLAQVLGALIWLGTHIAQATPTGDTAARPVSATLFGNFLIFLGAASLIAYLVLYFI
jgi:hypothetical protein